MTEVFASRRTLVARRFLRNRLAVASLAVLALLFVGCYALPPLLPYSYSELCEFSSRGESACLDRLEAFYNAHSEDPVTDEQLTSIYECLAIDGLDTPGCDDKIIQSETVSD